MTLDDPIIKKNLAKTLSQFQREERGGGGGDEDVFLKGSERACNCELTSCNASGGGGGGGGATKGGGVRSVLRKRNLSKQSEKSLSTNTPSGSCGDYSSNNNNPESSTDEEDDDDDDDDDVEDEDERGGEEGRLLEDEEVRSKSEWTAVTTNSEDDDYVEEEVNISDDEHGLEAETQMNMNMNDHPFAWEFQQVGTRHSWHNRAEFEFLLSIPGSRAGFFGIQFRNWKLVSRNSKS